MSCSDIPSALLKRQNIAELCNGSTTDSDSVCLGSNPSSAAKNQSSTLAVLFWFLFCDVDLNPVQHPSSAAKNQRSALAVLLWFLFVEERLFLLDTITFVFVMKNL